MKNIFIGLVVIILIGLGIYFFVGRTSNTLNVVNPEETQKNDTPVVETPTEQVDESTTTDEEQTMKAETILGTSVEERPIMAYHFGTGDTELLFIGGIHGGYEWNTSLLAFEFIDYLKKNPSIVPSNVRVTVVPVLNPDGLYKVTGTTERFTKADVSSSNETVVAGRFNTNNVDLNRNFDCDWQTQGVWQNKTVSGGSSAFSEPETKAIRDYVNSHKITASVTWYSAAGGVFASNCHNDILPETLDLTNAFAKASGYKAFENFDFYAITGDMVNWFAKNNIPAISVLLTSHDDIEWSKNIAGIEAILNQYAE